MSAHDSLFDAAEVRRTLALIRTPGQVVEVRCLHAKVAGLNGSHECTASGYFDNYDDLVAELERIKSAKGIYITMNEVKPDCLARAANRLKKADKGETTNDAQITRRAYLLIDCDPIREPKDISSSDAEHEAAIKKTRDIEESLDAYGWPAPRLLADSGNGGSLVYAIDLPADDGGIVQRVLQSLALLFNDDSVKIDTSVFNPARIFKLYGTRACKGDSIPTRPHRISKIIAANEYSPSVSRGQIEAIIALTAGAEQPPADAGKLGSEKTQWLDDWIAKYGLDVSPPHTWNNGGRMMTFNTCPMCEHGGDGPFIGQLANGAIVAQCHHDSCNWNWHDLREKVEPAAERKNAAKEQSATDDYEREPVLTWYSDIEPREVDWLWPGHFPSGCISVLNGLPGGGKSLLALYFARQITRGEAWPDGSHCEQGSVILMTAEDDPNAVIRPRLDAIGADVSKVARFSMVRLLDKNKMETQITFTLQDVDALDKALAQVPDCRLVVLDPIGSFVGKIKSREEEEVRSALAPLVTLAEKHRVAVLIITHTRKSPSDFADDTVLGSRAFTAIARSAWHLYADGETKDKERRELLPGKFNLGKRPLGRGFAIEEDGDGHVMIVWEEEPLNRSANDPLIEKMERSRDKDSGNKIDEAKDFLLTKLRNGPRLVKEIIDEAKHELGISERTLTRARQALGIEAYKDPNPGPWWIKLSFTPLDEEQSDDHTNASP